MSQISVIGGKFAAVINGKTVKRSNRRALERLIRNAEADATPTAADTSSRFTINQRFGFVTDMVTMLARGEQASVVVSGPGGLGKSHTVVASLNAAGFRDLTTLDEIGIGDNVPPNSYRVIKGYSTPKGLYRTLY